MQKITFEGRNLTEEKTISNFPLYLYFTSYAEKRERRTPLVKTPHSEILHLVILPDVINSLPLDALGLLIWICWITMLVKAILWLMRKMALRGRTLHRRRRFLIFRLLLRFAFSALNTLLLAFEKCIKSFTNKAVPTYSFCPLLKLFQKTDFLVWSPLRGEVVFEFSANAYSDPLSEF